MRPSKKDIKLDILIAGQELEALKELTYGMAEAYGLDRRIERYKGTRPIGFYMWDMDCLLDVIAIAIERDKSLEPQEISALESLLIRLREASSATWGVKSK